MPESNTSIPSDSGPEVLIFNLSDSPLAGGAIELKVAISL